MKKKIIVTGGAGFIGSHIVDAYLKLGHQVVVLDDLSKGSLKNINPKAKFYKVNIENLEDVEKIFKKEKPDIVNHHAAKAEVVKSLVNPIETFNTNVLGTINLCLAFGKFSPTKEKFIFASTCALYGNPPKLPVNENQSLKPISPYGLSKLLAEEVINFYSNFYNFPYLIFRYSNIYGPRQNPKGEAGVVAIFSGLMKNNLRPTIFGDDSKGRDYLYVEDVVRANVLALKNGKNEILNLGTGRLTLDIEIFNLIAKEFKFKENPIFQDPRPGEVYRISLDSKKARKILGWKPKVKLEIGIKKTVRWIKENKD